MYLYQYRMFVDVDVGPEFCAELCPLTLTQPVTPTAHGTCKSIVHDGANNLNPFTARVSVNEQPAFFPPPPQAHTGSACDAFPPYRYFTSHTKKPVPHTTTDSQCPQLCSHYQKTTHPRKGFAQFCTRIRHTQSHKFY